MYKLAKKIARKTLTETRNLLFGIGDSFTFLRRLERQGGLRVLAGPFAGMKYLNSSSGSVLSAKLLGTYELELHPVIARLVREGFDEIVDVGCAEGYYLAGIGYACRRQGRPLPRLTGYDTDAGAIGLATELVQINGLTGAVELRSQRFSGEGLERGRIALICDIEGDEATLLDPGTIPALRRVEMLVEVHDVPGTGPRLELLERRFRPTHAIQVSRRRDRTLADFPSAIPVRVSPQLKLSMMNEHRQFGNTWLHLVPRAGG